ncbi:hypothetical protein GPA19_10995 [Azoarcus indigens]|uniref:Putative iron-regulated protein n=1 Tax=Azoarcus indigens TaxID=29545 RepID=A0A4R6E6A6_9RHOO|nr:ChaN family lipoprotein [Azoarcus indigens]NMG65475.1 hypothetical protein [Azoarcus indigens]TDN53447.1 putative iron-regulated protein [Azoarcus indigens]
MTNNYISRRTLLNRLPGVFALALLPFPAAAEEAACVPPGTWLVPGKGAVAADAALAAAAAGQVVLLGERHDSHAHHRWQLETLKALRARRPDLTLALEMFPRRAQPALQAWVAGELDEAAFLERSNWNTVWRMDAGLYLPILRYARDTRLPLQALNVDRELIRRVTREGFARVEEDAREGLSAPAPASGAYRDWLAAIHASHASAHGGKPDAEAAARFVEAQLVWDRAFAQGIRGVLDARPGTLVVALIGNGHLRGGDGVARQLADLGVGQVRTFLPWDAGEDCKALQPGYADAVVGLPPD